MPYPIDPAPYGLTPEQADRVLAMAPDELEYAYRYRLFQYRVQDAKTHAADVCDDPGALASLTEDDYEYMAELFADNYDCNRNENDQWEAIVEQVIAEKAEEKKGTDR